MIRIGVVVFPGSNCDADALHGLGLAGGEPVALWHESATLDGVGAVILPGGFAYGDYLRAGVIARFSPVMRAVAAFAAEAAWSSGSATASRSWPRPAWCPARCCATASCASWAATSRSLAERLDTPFTRSLPGGRPLRMPVAHGEGCYYADAARSTSSSAPARSCSATPGPTANRPRTRAARRTRTARSGRSPAS